MISFGYFKTIHEMKNVNLIKVSLRKTPTHTRPEFLTQHTYNQQYNKGHSTKLLTHSPVSCKKRFLNRDLKEPFFFFLVTKILHKMQFKSRHRRNRKYKEKYDMSPNF